MNPQLLTIQEKKYHRGNGGASVSKLVAATTDKMHTLADWSNRALVALCKKSTRNQPISNHHTGIPTVGMTVGLRKINRVPTLI